MKPEYRSTQIKFFFFFFNCPLTVMMERHLVSAHLQLQYFRGGAESLPHQTWPDQSPFCSSIPGKTVSLPSEPSKKSSLSRQPSLFLIPPSQLLSAEMIHKTLHSQMPIQQLTALHPHHVFHPYLAVQNLHHQHRHNKSLAELPKKSQMRISGLKKEPLQFHAHSHRMWNCLVLMDQTLPSGTKFLQTSSRSWGPSNWKNWWSWRGRKNEW